MSERDLGRPIRLALFGTFDVANYGDLLLPRIFQREMHRRIPSAFIETFSPLGHRLPVAMAAGHLSTPLGEWTRQRRAELAASFDLIVTGGGAILHTRDELHAEAYGTAFEEIEAIRPSRFFLDGLGEEELPGSVAWHAPGVPFDFSDEDAPWIRASLQRKAYLSVRDEPSRQRLEKLGAGCDLHVVPDSGLLVSELFESAVLERRLRQLRALGSYPERGRPLVVQGSGAMAGQAAAIAQAIVSLRRKLSQPMDLVLLETGSHHRDGDFADALARALETPVYRMGDAVTIEDIAAAIAHGTALVAASMHAALTAWAFGVSWILLNTERASELDELAALAGTSAVRDAAQLESVLARKLTEPSRSDAGLEQSRARLARHFDTLAMLAERAVDSRDPGQQAERDRRRIESLTLRCEALSRAHDALRGRQAMQRSLFAEAVNDRALANAIDENAWLRRELASLRSELEVQRQGSDAAARAQEELDRVRAELARVELLLRMRSEP